MDKDLSLQSTLRHQSGQGTKSVSTQPARSSCWVALQRWVLWLGFAVFALSGWVRMGDAILNWYWLSFSGIRPGPLYLAVSGGLWGLVGLIALVWLIFRRPWYRLVGLSAALFLALTFWIDRLFIAAAPGGSSNSLFAALLTLILLACAALVLRPLGEFRFLLQK